MRWAAAHRPGIAAAVVAAVIGLLAGLAVAPSDTRREFATRTVTVGANTDAVRTRTVTRTRTITTLKPGAVTTRTVTEPAPAGTPGAPPGTPGAPPGTPGAPAGTPGGAPPVPRGSPVRQSFAGSGSRAIGTITIAVPATLRWTSSGSRFQLFFDGGLQAISSADHSGQTFAPAQTYYGVRVVSDGRWTIRIG